MYLENLSTIESAVGRYQYAKQNAINIDKKDSFIYFTFPNGQCYGFNWVAEEIEEDIRQFDKKQA